MSSWDFLFLFTFAGILFVDVVNIYVVKIVSIVSKLQSYVYVSEFLNERYKDDLKGIRWFSIRKILHDKLLM